MLGVWREIHPCTRGIIPYVVEKATDNVVSYIVCGAVSYAVLRVISTAVPRRASFVVSHATQAVARRVTSSGMCRIIRPAVFPATPQAT